MFTITSTISGAPPQKVDDNDNCKNKQLKWTDEVFNVWLDVCIHANKEGKMVGCGFSKHWDWAVSEFNKGSGCNLTQNQPKNKLDWMVKQYKLWKTLKGSKTGLGWNPLRRLLKLVMIGGKKGQRSTRTLLSFGKKALN